MKKISDVRVGDVFWAIDESSKPKPIELIVDKIDHKKSKILENEYDLYDVQFKTYNNKMYTGEFFYTNDTVDYDKPRFYTLNFENKSDYVKLFCAFDKENLEKAFIDKIHNSIDSVEQVIKEGQENLQSLKDKLRYFTKQISQNKQS